MNITEYHQELFQSFFFHGCLIDWLVLPLVFHSTLGLWTIHSQVSGCAGSVGHKLLLMTKTDWPLSQVLWHHYPAHTADKTDCTVKGFVALMVPGFIFHILESDKYLSLSKRLECRGKFRSQFILSNSMTYVNVVLGNGAPLSGFREKSSVLAPALFLQESPGDPLGQQLN